MNIVEILDKHKKWLNDEGGGERANLRGADLRGADLHCADLHCADLSDANLYNADLDYSCLPLWCGGLSLKIDDRIARQLIYHICRIIDCSPDVSEDIKKSLLTPQVIEQANQFHRVDECGEIKITTTDRAEEGTANANN